MISPIFALKRRLAAGHGLTVYETVRVLETLEDARVALQQIGYEPIGEPEATTEEVLRGAVEIARGALRGFEGTFRELGAGRG